MNTLRIVYDAEAFVAEDKGTGKGSYLKFLIKSLAHSAIGLGPNGTKNVDWPLLQGGSSRSIIWQQTWLPQMIWKLKPTVFIAPNNTAPVLLPKNVRLLAIVHDLILLDRLEEAPLKHQFRDMYRGWLLRFTIHRASLLLTVSNFTAAEIAKRFRKKALVIGNTISPAWYVRDAILPRAMRDPYILIVTRDIAHKNVTRAMMAFAAYRRLHRSGDVKLRMVGVWRSRDAIMELAEKIGIEDSTIVEPYIAEPVLQELYRRALGAFMPSLKEGFGIPVIEAMASGTPIVCSTASSLPEIGGDAAIYADPMSENSMADALLKMCSDEQAWNLASQLGLARAEYYHPDRIESEIDAFWRTLPSLLG